jgi:uncharacterized membrane protein
VADTGVTSRQGVVAGDAAPRHGAEDTVLAMTHRLILAVTRHWLAVVNVAMGLVLGVALLAPWLMLHGAPGAGQLIYLMYRPLCHQLPERSFFLGGPQAAYTLPELNAHLGYEAPARWIGDAQLGFKMAFCERDAAIYAGWLAAGLGFGLVRRRFRGLSWQVMVALAVPITVDGVGQLFGAWESTWWMRVITGVLFAVGTVGFAYPFIEQAMREAEDVALRSLEESDAGSR